jgi:hypothetical protein
MEMGANDIADRHDFLDRISTWSLRQCTSVKCIWKMRQILRSKKYGKADLLLWWNERGSAVVTFRLEETTAGKGQWITGHRKLIPSLCAIPSTDSQPQ